MRNIVEGETKPIDVTLYDGEGATRTAVDGSGLTVTLVLRDRSGGQVQTTGDVAWLDQPNGVVRFSPAAADFTAARSPYQARFILTDSSSDTASYPNGKADEWVVRR